MEDNEEFDAKEYYNNNIKGKIGYCGENPNENLFVFGEWGYQCEILDTKNLDYMCSYVWSDVFDFLTIGTWKIQGFTITDEWKSLYLTKLKNSVKFAKKDYELALQKLKEFEDKI